MSKTEINLPKTAFSMKANLPVREPEILELWNKINLYAGSKDKSFIYCPIKVISLVFIIYFIKMIEHYLNIHI